MKIAVLLIGIAFFHFSCKDKSKLLTVEKNGVTIKGIAINDSLFNDTVYTFNTDKRLIKKELFSFGKPNGFSFDYYANGRLSGISNYHDGLKYGSNCYFDTLGKLIYSDNYFMGLAVGPVIYYSNRGDANKYFFTSLDNKTLLFVDYKEEWKGISEIVPKLINYTYEHQRIDIVESMSLFLYLIKMPKFSFEYSLYKKSNYSGIDEVILSNIKSDKPFIDLSLPVLNDSSYYSIRLNIYDSILNKRSVINKEVW